MQTIDTDRLRETIKQDNDLVVVNVLPRESFEEQHIPGSLNVPIESNDFLERIEKPAGGKDGKIVVYCANKDCTASSTAAKKLSAAGFSNVSDYAGGMKAWRERGLETSQSKIQTRKTQQGG